MKEEKKKSLSLFSADTLDSLAMAEVFGGADNCNGGNCVKQCACSTTNTKAGCGPTVPVNIKSCATATLAVVDPIIPAFEITSTPFISLDAESVYRS